MRFGSVAKTPIGVKSDAGGQRSANHLPGRVGGSRVAGRPAAPGRNALVTQSDRVLALRATEGNFAALARNAAVSGVGLPQWATNGVVHRSEALRQKEALPDHARREAVWWRTVHADRVPSTRADPRRAAVARASPVTIPGTTTAARNRIRGILAGVPVRRTLVPPPAAEPTTSTRATARAAARRVQPVDTPAGSRTAARTVAGRSHAARTSPIAAIRDRAARRRAVPTRTDGTARGAPIRTHPAAPTEVVRAGSAVARTAARGPAATGTTPGPVSRAARCWCRRPAAVALEPALEPVLVPAVARRPAAVQPTRRPTDPGGRVAPGPARP